MYKDSQHLPTEPAAAVPDAKIAEPAAAVPDVKIVV